MALDLTTIGTMIEAGQASIAHLAKHFGVTPYEVEIFLRENDIKAPTSLDPQHKHTTKLASAQLLESVDWKRVVFDDPEYRFINGLDLATTDGKILAQDLLRHYCGEIKCLYTNQPTDMVLAFDGNPNNFLISNLVPITQEAAKARSVDDGVPCLICKKQYVFVRPSTSTEFPKEFSEVAITIHLHGRIDPVLGVVFNERYIDALVDQWVRPYFENFVIRDILPPGMPPVPDLLVLWLWRHLSTVAFMKGLARVDVDVGGLTAVITKDVYLQLVVGLLQRAVQSRATIARPQSQIILPGSVGQPGVPIVDGR